MYKNEIIEWYIENGINDVIENMPFSHFLKERDHVNNYDNYNLTSSDSVASVKMKEKQTIAIIKNDSNTPDIYVEKARKLADESDSIEILKNNIESFDGLNNLKSLATNNVFADGKVGADILILGEAPGEEEDKQGIPFCGQSGQLLNLMFGSIGYQREDLYITNTIFWRPPANRTPTEEEVAICKPFVEKHIALVKPKIIVCMGRTAFVSLIDSKLSITNARQNIFEYKNTYLQEPIKVVPTFHPSYLLRKSVEKKGAWQDLLFIKNLLKG